VKADYEYAVWRGEVDVLQDTNLFCVYTDVQYHAA
jgi:hypothetical protein